LLTREAFFICGATDAYRAAIFKLAAVVPNSGMQMSINKTVIRTRIVIIFMTPPPSLVVLIAAVMPKYAEKGTVAGGRTINGLER
jgi:hypothetical protein